VKHTNFISAVSHAVSLQKTAMSSLQKAVAELGGSTSSLQSLAKSSKTVTSFEVGGTPSPTTTAVSVPEDATNAYKRSENLGKSAAYIIGGGSGSGTGSSAPSSAQPAGPHRRGSCGGAARRGSNSHPKKVVTTNTKHFTIISSHDSNVQEEKKNCDSSSSSPPMEVEMDTASMEIDEDNHRPQMTRRSSSKTQTFYQVGGGTTTSASTTSVERKTNAYTIGASEQDVDGDDDREIEQMEGVIDQGTKMPLVVLDGANVAYAYATAMAGMDASASSSADQKKVEPDSRGIQIATEFFLEAGLRALVVLPQYWFRRNNNSNNNSNNVNDMTLTPQAEILADLKARGLVVASPPTDDDDAYALTISRKEESRSLKPPRNGEGPGFVLSNDLFRDAQGRDPSGKLGDWLNKGRNESVGPGRISYTFGDVGTMNDRGERVLDFVPNPRHPLVVWMENESNGDDDDNNNNNGERSYYS